MNLTIEFLEKFQESGKLDLETAKIVDIILVAVNDWPDPINSLDEYENAVFLFLGAEVNRKRIEQRLLRINDSGEAWNAESLFILLPVFDYYKPDQQFKNIIEELRTVISRDAKIII